MNEETKYPEAPPPAPEPDRPPPKLKTRYGRAGKKGPDRNRATKTRILRSLRA